ncbi:MAG: D-alanyl-D-alanine carboxypeptidase, partial [Clostridia bacterium]|nr:D-alanyl-D-alanine carboxypeptidase [Clostridia bacterium]
MSKKTISFFLIFVIAAGLIPVFSLTPGALEDPSNEHCESSLVYCIEANQILYEKKIDDVHFPTGLTKLMTAVIASEYAVKKLPDGYDTVCTVSATAYHSTTGTDIELRINEKISFYNLLVGMLLAGANDCANVLAEKVGGSIDGFVMMMNDKAQELQMTGTFFTNPTGMHDPLMVTTARDMLTLAKYAMTDTTITEIASQKTVTIPATNRSEKRVIGTRNYLVSERATTAYYLNIATGLISGNTPEGGYCVIGTASHNGSNYIAVVMKASA